MPNFKLYYKAIVDGKNHGVGTKQACITEGCKERSICRPQILRDLVLGQGDKNIHWKPESFQQMVLRKLGNPMQKPETGSLFFYIKFESKWIKGLNIKLKVPNYTWKTEMLAQGTIL